MVGWTMSLMETVIGFLLVAIYAQGVAEPVSGGLLPPVFLGVMLQVGFGARLLWLFWRDYGGWAARRPQAVQNRLLALWAAAVALAGTLHLNAVHRYAAQMPEAGGSHLRLYFGTWELWLLLITAVGFLATLSHRQGARRIAR